MNRNTSEERKKEVNSEAVHPVPANRSAMKVYPAVIFLLALALVTHAKIDDQSYVHRFAPQCKSALRVAIQGFGKGVLKSTARQKCGAECRVIIEDFKRKRCKELCGLLVSFLKSDRPLKNANCAYPTRR